jgi:hypothetical protein
MDNGGTAAGGANASELKTFTITITKAHVWHNAANGLDVTGEGGLPDGKIVAADALEIINFLNAFDSQPVPTDGRATGPYLDVNADGSVAPKDALDIINHINASSDGEGESDVGNAFHGVPSEVEVGRGSPDAAPADLFTLLALDLASQPKRRR